MPTLAIEIPEELMAQLRQQKRPVQDIVVDALKRYLQDAGGTVDLAQTRTWQLCGSLEIRKPRFIVGHNEQGHPMTNEAEHVDEVLY